MELVGTCWNLLELVGTCFSCHRSFCTKTVSMISMIFLKDRHFPKRPARIILSWPRMITGVSQHHAWIVKTMLKIDPISPCFLSVWNKPCTHMAKQKKERAHLDLGHPPKTVVLLSGYVWTPAAYQLLCLSDIRKIHSETESI